MTAIDPPRLPREVPDWHADGACARYPELAAREQTDERGDRVVWSAWYDAKPGSGEHAAARTICAGCPVRMACAVGALERGEPWGMWGGLDRVDRKAIAARFGYPVPAALPEHGTNSRYAKHGCRCPECREAHAIYEVDRRARAQLKARARDVWVSPLALDAPLRVGRRWLPAGQLVLPLAGLPAPRPGARPKPARSSDPSGKRPLLALVA